MFSEVIAILPFDAKAAAMAGAVLASLRRVGAPIGPYDALIAGHALALRLTLVTHSTREFERVKGLRLVDWVQQARPAPAAVEERWRGWFTCRG